MILKKVQFVTKWADFCTPGKKYEEYFLQLNTRKDAEVVSGIVFACMPKTSQVCKSTNMS